MGSNLTLGGNDTVKGGGGNDAIDFGAAMTDQDSVDGGSGNSDTLYVAGNYSSGGTDPLGALGLSGVSNVERVVLGERCRLRLQDRRSRCDGGGGREPHRRREHSRRPAGAELRRRRRDRRQLLHQERRRIRRSDRRGARRCIRLFRRLRCRAPPATRSTGSTSTTTRSCFSAVAGIDAAITSGHLDDAAFDGDLAAIFGGGGSHPLGAMHAVLFTADSGTENGRTFLIVDGNNTGRLRPRRRPRHSTERLLRDDGCQRLLRLIGPATYPPAS